MFRTPALIAIILLLAPSALAIALGIPNIGEIVFQPHKEVNFEYTLQNNLPTALPVKAVLTVSPELSDYVRLSKDVTTIAAGGSEHIVVTITFPDELPYGLYSIGFTAVEEAPTQGAFIAHVGASHTVKVLNPYPHAKLLLEFKGPATLQASGTSNIQVGVRNIGNENVTETRLHATLNDGNKTQEAYSDRVTIPALEERTVSIPLEINVPPGVYTLELNSTKGSQEGVVKQIQVGTPVVSITSLEKYSFEMPALTVGIKNSWREPLTEGTLALTVYDSKKTALFEASSTGIILQPGDNTVSLRIKKPHYLTDGNYTASLQVLAPPFYIGADGELEVHQTEIGKMLKEHQDEGINETPWEYENVSVDQPRAMRVAKNKSLYGIILVLAIAIFLFSVAMLFMKRRVPPNAQTTQQPKA